MRVNKKTKVLPYKLLDKRLITYSTILIFSTTFYIFVDLNSFIDYFQVSIMCVSSFLLLKNFSIQKSDISLYIFILTLLGSTLYTGIFNLFSLIYSLLFILTFIEYKHLIKINSISANKFTKILRTIIFSYGIVLIIQQLSKYLKIPAINGLPFYIDNYRYNSLSNEPSHTSIIILIIMISYMYVKSLSLNGRYNISYAFKKDYLLWGTYLYILLTSGSSTGFLVIPVTFLYFIRLRNLVIFIILLITIFSLSITYIDIPAFIRIKELLPVLLTLDPEQISFIDQSGAARINPILYYFSDFNITSPQTWFGYGRGYSEPMLMDRIIGINNEYATGAGGVFPILFYDYGLISGILFLICLYKHCYSNKTFFLIIIWILFFYSATLNSYLQWLYFTISYSTIHYTKSNKKKNEYTIS